MTADTPAPAPAPSPEPSPRQRIQEKLTSKGATRECTLCGSNSWKLGSYVPLGTSDVPNHQQTRAVKVYPLVAVVCSNCGNTHFVNLLTLGFSESELESLRFPPPDA